MSAPCPRCGASFVSTQRTCANCGLDLWAARRTSAADTSAPSAGSFVERYRGTPWETPPPPAPQAEPIRWRGLILVVGLPLVVAALILASRAHYLDIPLNPVVALPLALFVPIFAGWISKIVPGTRARGLIKSFFVAYIGTTLLGLVLIVLHAWTPILDPEIPIRLSLIVDQLPLEIAGAIAFRIVLLLTER